MHATSCFPHFFTLVEQTITLEIQKYRRYGDKKDVNPLSRYDAESNSDQVLQSKTWFKQTFKTRNSSLMVEKVTILIHSGAVSRGPLKLIMLSSASKKCRKGYFFTCLSVILGNFLKLKMNPKSMSRKLK